MIFEDVTLNNLGAFKGMHSLDLSIADKSKPLVLIGGMNGAGKTTLLTAIQLALYGKLCDEASSFSNYNSFLKEIINDSAMDGDEDFSVSLSMQFDGFPIMGTLCITRSWSKNTKGYKENFSVSSEEIDVLPEEIKDIEDNWIEIMQRILSPELSDLFFFDGEKIIKLADEKTSAELFKESISTLLGLDLVGQLNNDIKSITSTIGRSQDSELAQELIQKEEERISIEKDIERLEIDIKDIDAQLESNKNVISLIEEEFQLQSGAGFTNHQLKKEETTLIKSQIE
ncbi:AAA family ATPase, partial [Gammaproteobacteria bacterium]|nr:AAA family ATPase [Gammaproteobacteria bacterium]